MPKSTDSEFHQQLAQWNATSIDFPRDLCIHQLFELQVKQTPDAVAVVFENQQLTYQELNQQANQLAHYLLAIGVKPSDLIGIFVRRSFNMIIGILGILKAGGAYVPLDPMYPDERLSYMLDDAKIQLLLTQQELQSRLTTQKNISLDTEWLKITQQSDHNPTCQTSSHGLAYIIYTSGSTGKPKGVLIEHVGLCNLALAQQQWFKMQTGDRILQLSSLGFDASIWEIVMALTSGATLHLIRKAEIVGSSLYENLKESSITIITIPPSVLSTLPIAPLPKLQTIIVAGEDCSSELVSRWQPGRKFFNAYGPTETTICATIFECSNIEQKPLIGKPVANTQTFVLDQNLQQVPIGVEGELHVSGIGLARGYLNRPEMTTEKFISHPYDDNPNARLYKTGDLVCYHENGNLEFMGRIDHQVKIRGFRIELGEIESALDRDPSIQQSCVLAREDEHGTKHLVAYIVTQMVPERVALSGTCMIEFEDDPIIQLQTKDISCGGVRLVGIPEHWQAGDDLRLVLQLPKNPDQTATVEGRIAWSEGQEAGVQFSMSSPEQGSVCKNVNALMEQINMGNVEIALQEEHGTSKHYAKTPQFTLKRLPIRSVCFVEYGDGDVVDVRTEHIDCESIRLIGTPSTWSPGIEVCVHLQLPNIPDDLLLDGIVTWCEGERAGVDFFESCQAKTQICDILDRMLKNHRVLDAIQRTSAAAQHIRKALERRLPAHMIPANIVFLDQIPLTPNGKIDRKALLTPDHGRAELIEEDFEVAHSETQETIADIWSIVLHMPQVSIHDGFFELGGNSLSAARVITRIRELFHIELPLHTLFEYTTIAELASHIDAYHEEDHLAVPPLVPLTDKKAIPLSYSQQQLWLHYQLVPNVPVYNEPFTLKLGACNPDAIEQSLNEIIRRHEALRSFFQMTNGQPVQVIEPYKPYRIKQLDLRKLAENERKATALQHAATDAKTPFDLSQYPLFRIMLVQLGDHDCRLYITFHHIIMDGVSIYNVFLEELAILYRVYTIAEVSPLPPLAIQYTDYAIWQRQWLATDVLDEQWAYWRQQLADLTPLQLPTDRPYPAIPSFKGARTCFSIAHERIEDLKKISRHEGVTLFVTLLTAFKILLHRYTGQTDITIGTVTAGRHHAELEPMIGYFLDTLVLRTQFHHKATQKRNTLTFIQLLHRVRDVVVGAYAHQDLPFETLVTELHPQRTPGANPLFQVLFDLDPDITQLDNDWTLNQFDTQTDTAKFDLTMELDDRDDKMIGRIEYSTDLFDETTIMRMIEHYQNLLDGIAQHPQALIATLPLIAEKELQHFTKWNDTQIRIDDDICLHQLFEAQVERSPDAVAISFNDAQLTYQQLNQRANQLAHYLIRLGLRPESLVAVCIPRSIDMVIGLLGILKAGAAYVPLDPHYPKDRIDYIISHSQAPLLITHSTLVANLPTKNTTFVCMDKEQDNITKLSTDNPICMEHQHNLAYVIYTSGSTGQPKGVAIEHRSAVVLSVWAKTVFSAKDLAGMLASTSICFDLSIFELFVPLSWGGKIILVENALHLSQLPPHSGVTLINTVPSAMNELVRSNAVPDSVRVVNLAGEPLPRALVQKIYQQDTVKKVYNLYGPSEDTTYSTFSLVDKNSQAAPLIGRPIANTQAYVLDKQLQPVPIGVPGELYLGGDGLARGYYNRKKQTIESFIANPFSKHPYKRLYKTGDLVRYRVDGNLEYLGRIDFQVKIRGFRIELGEIETRLSQHEAIQENAVIVREDTPGDKRLVAYLVASPDDRPNSKQLRSFIQEKLPEYMAPSTFVFLDELPLTPNGKIDRKAFPEPKIDHTENNDAFIAPQNDIEQKMAEIFQAVLRIKTIGSHDNFFDLGGNSLLLVQAAEKLSKALNRDIPILMLLQFSTINALAEHLQPSSSTQPDTTIQATQDRAAKQKAARKDRGKKRRKG